MNGAPSGFSRILIAGLLLALLIEVVTLFCRFRCGLVATRDTRLLRRFTLGLRVHHGYVGVLMAVAAWGPSAGVPGWKGLFSLDLLVGAGCLRSCASLSGSLAADGIARIRPRLSTKRRRTCWLG